MSEAIRVGIVDSGSRPDQTRSLSAAAGFVAGPDGVIRSEPVPDRLGHGSAVLDVIAWGAPQARFVVAQVFRDRLSASAAQVAAALDWLVDEGVSVVNLSLGLRHDREVLAQACQRALDAGVILCASTPARGAPVFPAAYLGVFRMTGDARCARGEISRLDTAYADFGAHVHPLGSTTAGVGASAGCAHLTGEVARYLCEGGQPVRSQLRSYLTGRASHHGPERRTG
ncbi:subtilisin-like serine protease QhpE [Rhodocyclaceae bacterium SMB388]